MKKGALNGMALETPQLKKNGRPSHVKSVASTTDMGIGTSGRPTLASTIINDTQKREYRHSQNLKPQSILAPQNFDKEFSSRQEKNSAAIEILQPRLSNTIKAKRSFKSSQMVGAHLTDQMVAAAHTGGVRPSHAKQQAALGSVRPSWSKYGSPNPDGRNSTQPKLKAKARSPTASYEYQLD